MQERSTSLVAVVSEYGTLEGVVTVEDIVEEVVGEIRDENDLTPTIQVGEDGSISCDGDTSLADLERFGICLEGFDSVVTLTGAASIQLGRYPEAGDTLQLGDYLVAVSEGTESELCFTLIPPVEAEPELLAD